MKAIELFSGAGGLGMGLSLAGFEPIAVVEWDKWACDTIRQNQARGYPIVRDWPLIEGDVRDWIRACDMRQIAGEIDLVAGGPPCQPFSMGGKHKAHNDTRDMFPVAVDVVRRLRPKAFIFENVKGITRQAFANYFQYILLQLTYPEIQRNRDEGWIDHLARLEKHKTRGRIKGLTYNVVARVLNAANFGVPQKRERVFIVGFRNDQREGWSFPEQTHSLESLLFDQWINGSYWERHEVSTKKRPVPHAKLRRQIDRIEREFDPGANLKPWRTVRDALQGLPNPRNKRASQLFHDHRYQGGAKTYPGHTGSPMDMPAKTLKAGDHGVPGGENMLVLPDGTVRYFTVRESARLQTFPDGYHFHGSWSETMRQLGNAVPVALAQTVGGSVVKQLLVKKYRNCGD